MVFFKTLKFFEFFKIFSAREVSELILNASSKNTENTLIEWLRKKANVIYENQSMRGFFGFESSFQNCFWNLFSICGLSQICKIRNVWKLPIPFSRITLIPNSLNSSWRLKLSFWKKNRPTNSKILIKNFQA
jgi:hypothetical protein